MYRATEAYRKAWADQIARSETAWNSQGRPRAEVIPHDVRQGEDESSRQSNRQVEFTEEDMSYFAPNAAAKGSWS